MKIIHKITKQEAIDAYKQLNQINEEIFVEIENDSSAFIANPGILGIHNAPQPVPMPLFNNPATFPTTYC